MKPTGLHQQIAELCAWRPGKLAKGTLAMTSGMALRTVGQAGIFLIIARVLGVEAYGAYAAVLAIAGTMGFFGGFGVQTLMLRDVARDPKSFAIAWGRTLAAIGVSSPLLLGLYLLIAWTILPGGISWVVIVCIGVAELVLAPLTLAGISAYQGHERIGRAARLLLAPVLPRLVSALAMMPLTLLLPIAAPLLVWSALYALAALFTAVYTVWLVHCDLGFPLRPDGKGLLASMREGMVFAFGGAALKLYVDIDKTMLARLATLEAAGSYSAAYRVVDMVSVPIAALLAASLPRFFRSGEHNVRSAFVDGWRLLPLPLLYAFSGGLFLYFASAWIPDILGTGYGSAVSALQWLAWLPLVSLPRIFLKTLLIAGNRQHAVMAVIGAGAILNITLNLWLIPLMGWHGAVIATYVAEVAMGCVMVLLAK